MFYVFFNVKFELTKYVFEKNIKMDYAFNIET